MDLIIEELGNGDDFLFNSRENFTPVELYFISNQIQKYGIQSGEQKQYKYTKEGIELVSDGGNEYSELVFVITVERTTN